MSAGSSSDDPLEALRAAGFPLNAISREQHEVFAALTRDEVEVLVRIKRRLDQVGAEVEAHTGPIAGAALF